MSICMTSFPIVFCLYASTLYIALRILISLLLRAILVYSPNVLLLFHSSYYPFYFSPTLHLLSPFLTD